MKTYQHVERLGSEEVEGILSGTVYVFSKLDGCFSKYTQIMMADGSTKHISKIEIGDYVLSYNQSTMEVEPKKVTNVFVKQATTSHKWVNIMKTPIRGSLKSSVVSHKMTNVTDNHVFFTKIGDRIVEKLDSHMERSRRSTQNIKQVFWVLIVNFKSTSMDISKIHVGIG